GAHVRDQPDRALLPDLDAFVQLLGDAHGDSRGEAQLLGRFLLQCAGAERRGRRAPPLALLDRGDRERELERVRDDRPRGRLVLDLRLFPVELVQPPLAPLGVLLAGGLPPPPLPGWLATCHAIASPSRSGSVARRTRSDAFAAFLISASVLAFSLMVTYSGVKPFSTSTPSLRCGRSRRCPTVAFTV